jgi:hypothetical protein
MRLVVQPGLGTPLNEQRKQGGRKAVPDKQLKIDLARNTPGSSQDKAAAVNKQFDSDHDRSTIRKWLKEPQFNPKFVA